MLHVEGAPQLLADAFEALAPGALANGLVPRLDVVEAGRHEHRQRVDQQQVVVAAAGVLLDPRPLVVIGHRAMRVERAPLT